MIKTPKKLLQAISIVKTQAEAEARDNPPARQNANNYANQHAKRIERQRQNVFSAELKIDEPELVDEDENIYATCSVQAFDSTTGQVTTKKDFRCFCCDRIGHLYRNCPDKDKAKPFCRYCGTRGILLKNCKNSKCQDFYKKQMPGTYSVQDLRA